MVSIRPGAESLRSYKTFIENARTGNIIKPLSLPLETLQQATKGLRAGELTVIAGYEGMGKSLIASQIFFHGAEHAQVDKTTGLQDQFVYCTLEMDDLQIIGRFVMQRTGIDSEKLSDPTLLSDSERSKIDALFTDMGSWPFAFLDDGGLETSRIDIELDKIKELGHPRLVVVDYIQLLGDAGTDSKSLESASKRLKQIARNHKTHVIAISSMNRNSDDISVPNSKSLRGSHGIAHNADNVWVVHRPRIMSDAWSEVWDNAAILKILKQRSGRSGEHYLGWNDSNITFRDLLPSEKRNLLKPDQQQNGPQNMNRW